MRFHSCLRYLLISAGWDGLNKSKRYVFDSSRRALSDDVLLAFGVLDGANLFSVDS